LKPGLLLPTTPLRVSIHCRSHLPRNPPPFDANAKSEEPPSTTAGKAKSISQCSQQGSSRLLSQKLTSRQKPSGYDSSKPQSKKLSSNSNWNCLRMLVSSRRPGSRQAKRPQTSF